MYFLSYFILFITSTQANDFEHLISGLEYLNQGSHFKYTSKDIQPKWFQQDLDHFNPKQSKKWNMMYYENLQYWEENGPVYLFVALRLVRYDWIYHIVTELASQTNGAIFACEHRFYGKGIPYNGTNPADFEFLTERQALADVAELIKFIKLKSSFQKSKVVLIGYNRAGNIAAWMKEIYPELVDVVLASSARVFAQKENFVVLENIKKIIEKNGPSVCIKNIAKQFNRFENLLKTPKGISILKRENNICDDCDMTKLENKQYFFAYKIHFFVVMFSRLASSDYVKTFCECFNYTTEVFEPSNYETKVERDYCFDFTFDAFVNRIKQGEVFNFLPEIYQRCTEYGHFPTTASDSQPFTKNLPLAWYMKLCKAVFGDKFDEAKLDEGIKHINAMYGGRKPNVTAVIFTNGETDSLNTLGVLSDISDDAPAIIVPKSPMLAELEPVIECDLEEVKETKNRVRSLIKLWIGRLD